MDITLLGAHNIESRECRMAGLLIDGVMAVDAGSITSGLTLEEQIKLKAVLLTHQHYDHLRDIPALGMTFYLHGQRLEICSTQAVYDALSNHLLNDKLYPDFLQRPPEAPTLRFRFIEPGEDAEVAGYEVLAVPVNHAVPTVGYQVAAPGGKKFFYTSDTGPDLAGCWGQVAPDLLIIELTAPNRYDEFARNSGHLTPALLERELVSFREMKGYLPPVVLVHLNPLEEKAIAGEIAAVAAALGADIRPGYEGMQIHL